MSSTAHPFVVRYEKYYGSHHTLQLHAANRKEARIVAMETNAYVRRYPTSEASILLAA